MNIYVYTLIASGCLTPSCRFGFHLVPFPFGFKNLLFNILWYRQLNDEISVFIYQNCLLIFISKEEHLRTQNSDWQLFLFLIYHIPYIIKNFNFTFQQFDYAVPKMWFSFFVFITLGVHCISWIYKLMSLGKFSAIISSVFLLP